MIGSPKFLTLLLMIACSFGLSSRTQAEEVILNASKDNTLFQDAAGLLSNGVGPYTFAGRTGSMGGGLIRRGLMAFDVSGEVPAGATINSVRLELNLSQTIGAPTDVALHRVLQNWDEGTSNSGGVANPFMGNGGGEGDTATAMDATWIHTFSPGLFWTNAGGDFSPIASATTPVGAVGDYTWSSTAALVADAQNWLDNPTQNFGWLIQGDESALSTARRFASRENTNGNLVPRLVIDFTPVPEPSGVLAIMLMGIGLGMKRRRN